MVARPEISGLYLHTLDSPKAVSRLVEFYVEAHNTEIAHSAFQGQTPDEMYYGRGEEVPETLEATRIEARAARLKANREMSYTLCWRPSRDGAAIKAAA